MKQSPPPSPPRAKKRSTLPPNKSEEESETAFSPKANSTDPAGFHGSPGTSAYHIDRSSFPRADSAPPSSIPRTPSTLKSSKKAETPRDPLSCLAAPCLTPRSISGEQVAGSPPAPSSPPKSSTENSRRVTASAARRFLEAKLQTSIPRSTFYRWLINGVLPADKLVSKYLVRIETLQHFAEEATW